MPHRQLPNSTPTVIRTLTTARDTWQNTAAGDRAISADQWAQLDPANPSGVLNRLLAEASTLDLDLAAQAPLTTAITQTAARLTMSCSQFHQVLDLGIARGTFAPGARSYYDRDINASTIPSLASYADVLEAANKIVAGEAARATAEAAGVPRYGAATYGSGVRYTSASDVVPFVPMALPSAAEVGAMRDEFVMRRNQVQQAEVATDLEREALQLVYTPAQALAVDICDTVEFYYRKDPDDSSRRQKCARWGVVYLADATPATPTK